MLCQQATLVDRNGGTADVEDQEKSSTRTRKCYPNKSTRLCLCENQILNDN